MDTLYIVMPAYNEEENIKSVVESWYPILCGKGEDSRLVIADSGSTDATHRILVDLKEEYPKLETLEPTKKEHGPKVIALYKYAIKKGADYVFQTDSDGQTDPGEFQGFWKLRNSYSAIFGDRRVRGDGLARAMVEKVVCLLLRICFGVKVPDANAPFRLFRTADLSEYLGRLPEDYNLPNIMLTTYYTYYREKVLYKEISFKPRQAGKNSVNLPKIVRIGWQALKDFQRFKREM